MSEYRLILLLILVGLIAVALFLRLPPRRSRTQPGSTEEHPFDDSRFVAVSRDDGQHWLGGFVYYNPDDPALFVPKRLGLGWTLNFGHPQGKRIAVAALLLVLALAVLGPLVKALAI